LTRRSLLFTAVVSFYSSSVLRYLLWLFNVVISVITTSSNHSFSVDFPVRVAIRPDDESLLLLAETSVSFSKFYKSWTKTFITCSFCWCKSSNKNSH